MRLLCPITGDNFDHLVNKVSAGRKVNIFPFVINK